jgi:hypothetical protein
MPSVIRFAWQDGRRRAMEQALAVDFNMSFTVDFNMSFTFALCSQYLYHGNLQHNVRTIERSILDNSMFNT